MNCLLIQITAIFLFFFSTVSLANNVRESLKPYSGKIIRHIKIVRKNVFDDKVINHHTLFFYRWANGLHIVTREMVVRRELLFNEGDSLNLERMIETQRNLRLSGFLGEVTIGAEADTAGGVNLTVSTMDLWTTKIEFLLNVAGGKYTAGMALTEGNLLGRGKFLQALGQIGNNQDGYELVYNDGRLLGSRLSLNFDFTNLTFGNVTSISLARRLYSLSVPYGFSANYTRTESSPRLYYKSREYFRYKLNQRLFNFEAVHIMGGAKRISLLPGYSYEKDDYWEYTPGSRFNQTIPPDETISCPTLGVRGAVLQYDVERFVDAPGTQEDLTLGAALKIKIGLSEKAFGANYIGWFNAVSCQFLTKLSPRIFIGGADLVSWWTRDGRYERIRHTSEAAIYYKPATTHTLVMHALTNFAWRQKSTSQLLLGGGNGLRGFSFYELSGDKLAVGNLEYRFYLPIEILTVRPGIAAFFDIGNVWGRNEAIDLHDLRSDAGIGLRFGLIKSSTSRVIDLDFAHALTSRGFFITLSSNSTFNLGFASVSE